MHKLERTRICAVPKDIALLAAFVGVLAAGTAAANGAPVPYQGSYDVGFYQEGSPAALGVFSVARGRFEGSFVDRDQRKVTVAGRVGADGRLAFDRLRSVPPAAIVAEGAIDERGVVTGSFALDGRPGSFSGTRDGISAETALVREFDGDYDVVLSRGSVLRASSRCTVRNGSFGFALDSTAGERYDIQGYVLSDGTLVFRSVASAGGAVRAEGFIDADTFAVQGIYRLGDELGEISGRRVGRSR